MKEGSLGEPSKFLAVVLGTNWGIRNTVPQAEYDQWMQNRLERDETSGFIWRARLVRLANAFHTLLPGKVAGFDILRDRFHSRPTNGNPSALRTCLKC